MSNTYHYYIGDIQYTIESDLRRSDSVIVQCDNDSDDPDYCKGCEAGADSIHAHTSECNRIKGLT